jgi:hypothetical protein
MKSAPFSFIWQPKNRFQPPLKTLAPIWHVEYVETQGVRKAVITRTNKTWYSMPNYCVSRRHCEPFWRPFARCYP